ncbi:MAG: hypothetical protein ACLPPF_13125 [Rhodomicrobium sp.]
MPQLNYTQDDVEQLRHSMWEYGFGHLPDSIVPSALGRLYDEAQKRFESARTAEQKGEVNYRAKIVPLGPEASQFLCDPQMTELLFSVFGETLLPSVDVSYLIFYEEGDHLSAHLDEPDALCCVIVIVFLAASSPSSHSSRTGLVLQVFGEEMPSDRKPRLTIQTSTGGMVIGRGSKVWHERPPLEKGEHITVLAGCFRRSSYSADGIGGA